MARRSRPAPPGGGGVLGTSTWGLSGGLVIGLIFAYTGPFLTILAVVASIVYGPVVLFRLLAPKGDRKDLRDWG